MKSDLQVTDMLTTIKLDSRTRARLAELGKKGDSYDTILNRLMDEREVMTEAGSTRADK